MEISNGVGTPLLIDEPPRGVLLVIMPEYWWMMTCLKIWTRL